MAPNPNDPADTTMMGVVHDALRRDLNRFQVALAQTNSPPDRQRALATHAVWTMEFLHHHHHGEDAGLWPMVAARNPTARTLLDEMADDHARIAPIADHIRACAQHVTDEPTPAAFSELRSAMDALPDALLPHLDREIDELMPIVSATISRAEWTAWEEEHNLKGQSVSQLAARGHWLMDGLDPDRYQILIHLIPAVPRFVVVHGFARQYRNACRHRWGTHMAVGPAAPAPHRIDRATP